MILMGGDPSKVAPVESAMIKYFTAQGFPVVDAAVARGSFDITTLANSRELATKVAHQYAAEVIIVGQLDVANRSFKLGDVEVTSAEVTLSGKAINGDTGSVIASHSVSKKGEWVKVSEETASLLAKQLKEKLVNAWSRELTNVQMIKLLVSGISSYGDLTQLKDMLSSKVKGVKQVYQRRYADDMADIDVEVRGNVHGVADDLSSISVNGKQLIIKGIYPNKIEARLQRGQK